MSIARIPAPYPVTGSKQAAALSHFTRSIIDQVRRSIRPHASAHSVVENGLSKSYTSTRTGLGPLLTQFGMVWAYTFAVDDDWEEYTVISNVPPDSRTLQPAFRSTNPLLLRIDSGCASGQVFGELTCDCRQQLYLALRALGNGPEGVIICIPRQDGRGRGGSFKLAMLWLQQELGLNTIESAALLSDGGSIDVRTYGGAVAVMRAIGIDRSRSIRLLSNSPTKRAALEENGHTVFSVAHAVPATSHTRRHFEAKARCLGHLALSER